MGKKCVRSVRRERRRGVVSRRKEEVEVSCEALKKCRGGGGGGDDGSSAGVCVSTATTTTPFVVGISALDSSSSFSMKKKSRGGAIGASASSSGRSESMRDGSLVPRRQEYNGVFFLLLANFAVFLIDKKLKVAWIAQNLYLNHAAPRFWQFASACFCHASWQHLSSNGIMLYLFGKLIEEDEGAGGVIAAYLVTGAAGMLASILTSPSACFFSLGASGAVFGMYTIAVLLKLRQRSLKSLLEVAILAPFVWERLEAEVRMQYAKGATVAAGGVVSHMAHLGGAVAGLVLVTLLSAAPEPVDER